MKLIVGLGNPGKEYENTRHNIGFMFIDYYLDKKGLNPVWKKKFNGLYFESNINDEKVVFVKPQSFMNLSGGVVSKYINYFDIDINDLLVVCDDLDLFVGNYKIKPYGACGGHNGLRDIEKAIKTNEYKRLRIGISKDKDMDTKDYVLGNISKEDKKKLNDTYDRLCDLLDDYFVYDFDKLMSLYNIKNR